MKKQPVLYTLFGLCLAIYTLAVFFGCSSNATSQGEWEFIEEPDSNILKTVNARPLTDVKFESTPERIARGKNLTGGALWCFNCHTERDTTQAGWPPIWEKMGSGALLDKTDSTHLYAPNITPDKKTGIGSFSDDMIARAIREGVGHDDRALAQMPWWTFRNLSDEDVASIVTYLRSIPAISNKIPRRKLGKEGEEGMKTGGLALTMKIEGPDTTDLVARGKYLISATDCIGCHTGWYKHNPGVFGGGNPMHENDNIFSPNITSDKTGVGAWPLEAFIYLMRNGKGKSGILNHKMPWTSYKNLPDEDLKAIYLALMTTYPVKHIVQNRMKLTHCEVCGYEHGMGDQNKIEPLKPFAGRVTIPSDLAGMYLGDLFPDTAIVTIEKGKLVVSQFGTTGSLFPINDSEYFAEGFFAPVHFVRDAAGKVTELQYNDLGKGYRKAGGGK